MTSGNGTVADANVTNIAVACTNNAYALGGSLSGLAANGNVQLANGSDLININQNGSFVFGKNVAYQSSYSVTVGAQPYGQTCSVQGASGSGVMGNADITSVSVVCTNNPYTVGGTLSGLLSNSNVVIADNTTDALTLSSNGNFTFSVPVNYTNSYAVGVSQQPAGQNCNVTNGSGTVGNANVSNVSVACAAKSYTVGVSVSGLSANQNVIVNNGTDSLTVSANGNTNFSTALAYRSTYSVNIMGQPSNQTCSISSGGTNVSVPATNSVLTTISCVGYTVGGVVSGLNGNVTLANGTQSLTVSSNGNFAFPQTYPNNANYSVSVTTQPVAQNCHITNGSGAISNANAIVTVACSTQLRFASNQNAVAVLGQTAANANSVNAGTTASANTLNGPRGSAYISSTGGMYVADSNNNRVLGFSAYRPRGSPPMRIL